MIKGIFWLIISIAGILWLMGMKVSFKPFSVKFDNWGEGLCILGFILCFTIACSINYEKGKKEGQKGLDYKRGLKDGSDVVMKLLDEELAKKGVKFDSEGKPIPSKKEELPGGKVFKKSEDDKTEIKSL